MLTFFCTYVDINLWNFQDDKFLGSQKLMGLTLNRSSAFLKSFQIISEQILYRRISYNQEPKGNFRMDEPLARIAQGVSASSTAASVNSWLQWPLTLSFLIGKTFYKNSNHPQTFRFIKKLFHED